MVYSKIEKLLESKKTIFFMVFSICIYAAFKDSWKLLADIFQTLVLLLSFVFVAFRWDFFKKIKFLWLLPVALILQVVSWYYSSIFYPDIAVESPKIGRLFELFVFFFFAIWLKGKKEYIWAVLISFAIGSIFTLSQEGLLLNDILKGVSGVRVDFGYRNAQHGALIIGASLLIALVYFSYIYKECNQHRALFLCAGFFILFYVTLLLIMQTRQAILGVVVSLLCLAAYKLYINKKYTVKNCVFFLISFVSFLVVILSFDIVSSRLSSEAYIVTDYILKGDFDNIPYTSFGVRLNLWIESFLWIPESIFLGFGDGVEKYLILESTRLPDTIVEEYRHIHSSYIATVLRFGLLGLTLCLLLLILPVVEVLKFENEVIYIKYIAVMFLGYWLFVNFFESFWYMKAGLWTYTVFMAGIYSIPLAIKYENYLSTLERNNRLFSSE
ncbi:O-antigen ligase family protein [Neptuniibacter sp. QD34_54]|uniref:O-antigen ligase family protein n=1 Tax=Neptuniibacter sp. QD34_54 TaxID=3398208 RepID=UPI0039F5D2B8